MPCTDNRRLLVLVVFTLLASAAFLAPSRASADSPAAIVGASRAAFAIRASLRIGTGPRASSTLLPAPKPADRGFVSDDLLRKATDVVNNGISVGHAAGGTFYVTAQPRGLGAVVSIRYRR